MIKTAQTLAGVHTLRLLENKNLKNLGLNCVAKIPNKIYKKVKVDIQLEHEKKHVLVVCQLLLH